MTTRNEVYYNERPSAPAADDLRRQAQQRDALQALVRRVIREEFNEQDRLLIRLHWYRGKSAEEIAQLIGLDRSTVFRRMDRIHKTIYDRLKYAVDYRFDDAFRSEAHETLQQADRGALALEALDGIGARLQNARRRQRLSLGEVSRRAGIPQERMRLLESDGRRMMMTELSALCKTLGLGVNELLFGPCAEEMRQ